MSRSSVVLAGAGLVCAVLVGGGLAASNAAPQAVVASGQLTACVVKKSGAMRLVTSAGSCKKKERAVSWNVTGPAGAPGAAGAQGAQGAQGLAGAQGAQGEPGERGSSSTYAAVASQLDSQGNFVTLAIDGVPPGFYTVQADFTNEVTYDESDGMSCRAYPYGSYASYSPSVLLTSPGNYHVGGVIKLLGMALQTVTLDCASDQGVGPINLSDVSFTLTGVEKVTVTGP